MYICPPSETPNLFEIIIFYPILGFLCSRCLLTHLYFQSLLALRSLSYGSHCFQVILFGWSVLAISPIGASKRATNLNPLDTNCNISYLFSTTKIAFWGLFHNISRIRHTTFLLNHIVNLGIFPYIAPFCGP